MFKSPVNVRVGFEFVPRGEKPTTDLTAMRFAAVVQTHLKAKVRVKIYFTNILNLTVFILTNSKEEDAVPHFVQ